MPTISWRPEFPMEECGTVAFQDTMGAHGKPIQTQA